MPWWAWIIVGTIIGIVLFYGYFLFVFSKMRW
jgi:hypothetical protein